MHESLTCTSLNVDDFPKTLVTVRLVIRNLESLVSSEERRVVDNEVNRTGYCVG
jgi:hypothetical protein